MYEYEVGFQQSRFIPEQHNCQRTLNDRRRHLGDLRLESIRFFPSRHRLGFAGVDGLEIRFEDQFLQQEHQNDDQRRLDEKCLVEVEADPTHQSYALLHWIHGPYRVNRS